MTCRALKGVVVCIKGGVKLTKEDEKILSEFAAMLRKDAKEIKRKQREGVKRGRR